MDRITRATLHIVVLAGPCAEKDVSEYIGKRFTRISNKPLLESFSDIGIPHEGLGISISVFETTTEKQLNAHHFTIPISTEAQIASFIDTSKLKCQFVPRVKEERLLRKFVDKKKTSYFHASDVFSTMRVTLVEIKEEDVSKAEQIARVVDFVRRMFDLATTRLMMLHNGAHPSPLLREINDFMKPKFIFADKSKDCDWALREAIGINECAKSGFTTHFIFVFPVDVTIPMLHSPSFLGLIDFRFLNEIRLAALVRIVAFYRIK
jgi:hypothetical protein